MPRQFTGTMVQILAEKEVKIVGKGNITDILKEEAGRLGTELGVEGTAIKVTGGYVSINCGDHSVGLQTHGVDPVIGIGGKEPRYIITAEGLTKHGEPLPTVIGALQRLGYTPKSGSAIPVDALGLL